MMFLSSRWKFFLGYVVVFIFAMAAIGLYDSGADGLAWLFGIVALACFLFFEYMIRSVWCKLTKHSIEFMHGSMSRISLNDITSMSVRQSPIEYFLRVGDLVIHANEKECVLAGFGQPSKIKRAIEKAKHELR